MVALYEKTRKGDGFVSVKRMEKDKVYGYEAMKLSTGERYPLVIRDIYAPDDWPEACRIGPYLFHSGTIDKVHEEIGEMIRDGIEPIYLDEIGPMELAGLVFDKTAGQMVDSGLDVIFAIRNESVEPLMERYNVSKYQII